MTPLAIYIADLQSVSDKATTIIRDYFSCCWQGILRTERIDNSLAFELYSLWPCPFDVVDVEWIGGFVDVFVAVRDRLDISGKRKICRCCALGNEDFWSSACDIMLEEG